MAPAGMVCPNCGTSNPSGLSVCPKCATPFNFDPNATMAGDFSGGPSSPASQETDFAATQWSGPDPAEPAGVPSGPLLPGAVLGGRYEIVQLLGEGGMGAVYKARDLELDRDVALKVIRPELADKPGVLDRFKQEIILARQVTHRNVIRIFDLGTADGIKFITMEFIEGQVLKNLLRERGKYSPEDAADLMMAVAEGLDAAHCENVIHRDLKPQNIMVDTQGRALVMDFGLADFAAGTEGAAQSGSPMGTPDYMSPEQVRCEDIDARSDVFTMGVILYELLTGKLPFDAPTPLGAMLQRVQKPARPPIEADPTIPKALNEMVVKCMAMDPAARYRSAGELLHALQVWRGVVPKGGLTRTWKWITASLAALLVVAGGIATREILNKPPPKQNTVTLLIADFRNTTGEPVFDRTLEPMFRIAMEGAGFVNAYDRTQLRSLGVAATDKLDEAGARQIAVSQGLGTIVSGLIERRGAGYRLSARAIQPVTGNPIASADANAPNKDQVLSALTKVATSVRKGLGDDTSGSAQRFAMETITAGSLEAVHEYAVGMNQLSNGKFDDALQSLSAAVQVDPKFGLAYAVMASASRNLGRSQDAEKYIKLAMAHLDRMTERERYRTRGFYYLLKSDLPKCVEEYGALIARYSSDVAAHNNLAFCAADLRNIPKAVQETRRAAEILPKRSLYRGNLAIYLAFAGDFQAAEKEARAALQLDPASAPGFIGLAYAQVGQAQLRQAADTYQKLEKVKAFGSIAASGLADLALYEGRFSDAARILEQGAAAELAAKNSGRAADKFVALAYTRTLQGQNSAALAAAERALANSKTPKITFLAARIFVEAGRLARARELASGLASELQTEPQVHAKLIEGEIAMKGEDARPAIKVITEANNQLDTWIGRFDLGRAYFKAGAFAEADSEFDRCIKRRGEALSLFLNEVPSYGFFPPVYYYLGRVREGLMSEGFAESYRTYLKIRGTAGEDPLLAEVRRRAGP